MTQTMSALLTFAIMSSGISVLAYVADTALR